MQERKLIACLHLARSYMWVLFRDDAQPRQHSLLTLKCAAFRQVGKQKKVKFEPLFYSQSCASVFAFIVS